MAYQDSNVVSWLDRFFYISLILVYFVLGIYLINQTSITSDESAYIGAAYAYTKGLGLNQEHPLFLKLINSLVINLYFPDYKLTVPDINIVSGEENIEARLAAFNLGYSLLMERPENFNLLLFSLRFCYLFINSIFLFWLYFFAFIFKVIPPRISICFAILVIFSPSFYSHNFLIAFDVPVSIYALLTIWTITIFVRQINQINNYKLCLYFIVLNFLFFVAINSKFSNLILVPIVLGFSLFNLIYILKNNQKKLGVKFAFLVGISLFIQTLLISLMYGYAFRNVSNQSILDNLKRYFQGIQMNLSTVGGIREPFWQEKFTPMNSLEYFIRIFYFKENLALFVIILLLLLILIYQISTNYLSCKKWLIKMIDKRNRWQLLLYCFIISYPLIYFVLTYKSRFIIGYRYFYPLIIFIYFYLALSTFYINKNWQKYLLMASFSLYIYFGLLGIPQSLSYVNPLWTQEKWKLTDDSTMNWGQETQHVVQYLLNNNLLPEKNADVIAYKTFGVNISFVQYLLLLSQQKNYPIDIESYYNNGYFNPDTTEIAQLPAKYLLIDSTVKQQIISQITDNYIAQNNWKFLSEKKPIYSRNDIIFLYKIR
ncbi:MAG TPA: hypothetical protein DCF68_19355 [Cyanothece sp. UBA12306]|nr:hypothetical protein [Cyanothece sp. UBA12306]